MTLKLIEFFSTLDALCVRTFKVKKLKVKVTEERTESIKPHRRIDTTVNYCRHQLYMFDKAADNDVDAVS